MNSPTPLSPHCSATTPCSNSSSSRRGFDAGADATTTPPPLSSAIMSFGGVRHRPSPDSSSPSSASAGLNDSSSNGSPSNAAGISRVLFAPPSAISIAYRKSSVAKEYLATGGYADDSKKNWRKGHRKSSALTRESNVALKGVVLLVAAAAVLAVVLVSANSRSGGGAVSDLAANVRVQRNLVGSVVDTDATATAAGAAIISTKTKKRHDIPKSGRPPATPVPPNSRQTFYIDTKHPINRPIARALRMMGWRRVENRDEAFLIYSYGSKSSYFPELRSWQRYNHIPNHGAFNIKDEFQMWMTKYEQDSGDTVWTLPETYRLEDEADRSRFVHRLDNGGGMDSPWVLKKPRVNQGKGIAMLGPHTPELTTVVADVTAELAADPENAPKYIIQKYICRELTIQRRKFDFRVFWMVASLDPLVVLYHDGYVRIGNSDYDESDFSSTTAHLTTHTGLAAEGKGSWSDLRSVLTEYHSENRSSNPILAAIDDPMEHVQNQVKQALGQLAAAFKEPTFNTASLHDAQNGFGVYGADFILDQDLDAWFIEPQNGCGLDEDWQFRVDMHNSIFGSMGNIVEEVAERQEVGLKLDHLESLAPFEVVYDNGWMYKYEGYERSQNKGGCQLSGRAKESSGDGPGEVAEATK
mmetsp:Transcript_29440/g.69020  ORF Transcript_29440/g.69020 Transcript_29440/m.69020 type:complete len:640 (-) Transcript_29440:136-2055(-)|eukprot:CAMPEP_0185803654 /NCGR_PEP_ID=MMETSP1322-20130828/2777_1 /TAXON_ID=265543 /ORGANISM="Minutocellus polymorphus, Strain RCC2270" /LENGTH=639 /DNA_ID=CAMNT_0028499561 /DNA_START=65 /DNA_END=1984 /DNA_ORIENTATION=+